MSTGATSGQPRARLRCVTAMAMTAPVMPMTRNDHPVKEVARPLRATPVSSRTKTRSTTAWPSGSRWLGRVRVWVSM
jgi:hypothetical protein